MTPGNNTLDPLDTRKVERQGQSFQVDDPQSKTVGALKQQLFADALEVPLRAVNDAPTLVMHVISCIMEKEKMKWSMMVNDG